MATNNDGPLSEAEYKQALMTAGKLSGQETPTEVKGLWDQFVAGDLVPGPLDFPLTRGVVNGLTMGASGAVDRLFGVKRPDGGLTETIGNIAGSIPTGGIIRGALERGAARYAPSVAAAITGSPRIGSVGLSMAESALQGGAQTATGGGDLGDVATSAGIGAGAAAALEGPLRAIGYIYAKGIRRPPIGPKPEASLQGRINPTLARPFDPPNVSEWDGMNTGLQRVADKWGIPLPLLSLRPNDPFVSWLSHKTTQIGSAGPYLQQADRKIDEKIREGFSGLIESLSTAPMLQPKATGDFLAKRYEDMTEGTLKDVGRSFYNDIMEVGIQGKRLGDWQVQGDELADQLTALIKRYEGVPDPHVNGVRQLIADLSTVPPERLSVGESQPLGLEALWKRGQKLWAKRADTDGALVARDASQLVGQFIRDKAETINPNTSLLFHMADKYWSTAKALDESEIGKVMAGHADQVVSGLTRDITTINNVRQQLNGSDMLNTGPKMGDKFLEELSRRRLQNVFESSIDPVTKKLNYRSFAQHLDALAGTHGNKDEYLDALLQNNKEVRGAMKELDDLARAIEPTRHALTPRASSLAGGGPETYAPETVLSNAGKATGLLMRFIYLGKTADLLTGNMPAAVNPLLGGLRPALPDGTKSMGLLRTLRRGTTSTGRTLSSDNQ